MNLISFDLEIAKELPDGCADWKSQAPLGISCSAHWDGFDFVKFHDTPQLSQKIASMQVDWMIEQAERGKRFLTWNGCSFDFNVLAQESGRWKECAMLCLEHVDMMLIATISKGWFVGLDRALEAHGIESKQHKVQLNDGSWIEDMSGAKAPAMWKAGETTAVLEYLRGDVERPLLLAIDIEKRKQLRFKSKNGKTHAVPVDHLYTVKEMLQKPMADNSWMDNPPTKRQFVKWMIPYVPKIEDML